MRAKWHYTACGAILLTGITACSTNTLTGRQQVSLISDTAVIKESSTMYSDMVKSYDKKKKISQNAALVQRVTDITNRVIDQAVRYRPETAQWKWELTVIDEDTINAFCMPGGKMGIYRGIVEKIEATDDEIAMVMGHEIAHAMAGHGAERMSLQLATNLTVTLLAIAAGKNDNERRAYYNLGGLAALAFINLPNSRNNEEEADRLGIEFATRAGYNPDAAASLWNKMGKKTGQTSRVDFLSTHPSPIKREETLRGLALTMRAQKFDPQDVAKVANPWIRSEHNKTVAFNPLAYAANAKPLRLATYVDPTKPPTSSVAVASQTAPAPTPQVPPTPSAQEAPQPPLREAVAMKPSPPAAAATPSKMETPPSTTVAALETQGQAVAKPVPENTPTSGKEPVPSKGPAQPGGILNSLSALLPQSVSAQINRVFSTNKTPSTTEVATPKNSQPTSTAIEYKSLPICDEACKRNSTQIDADLKELYLGAQWKKLEETVSLSGYKTNLNYFYLARAAQELGDVDRSKHYFESAIALSDEPEFSCEQRGPDACLGLDIKALSKKP